MPISSNVNPMSSNVNPLQYSCLENSMGRGAHGGLQSMGVTKKPDTTVHTHIPPFMLKHTKIEAHLALHFYL